MTDNNDTDHQNGPTQQDQAGMGQKKQISGTTEMAGAQLPKKSKLPDDLPVVPLDKNVVYPGMILPMHVSEDHQLEAVEQAIMGDKMFLALLRKDEEGEEKEATPEHLYQVGTTCVIVQMLRMPDGSVRFLAQGLSRTQVEHYTSTENPLVASVKHLEEEEPQDTETQALFQNLRNQFLKLVDSMPQLGDDAKVAISNVDEAGRLADMVAANLDLSKDEKQEMLETLNVKERLQRLTNLMVRQMQFVEAAQKIQSQAESEMSKAQREYYLRQQLKAIQEELGETEGAMGDVEEIREQLDEKDLPEEAQKEAERELNRLQRINPSSPEYTVARTYLDWVVDLPWKESTPDNLDLEQARGVLEEDHYGLEDVKERMLEFLAVRKLRDDNKGSILCFVGPPGTGKTSIGKSIARAMGREYIRISLGGVRDEAEIRGHRRTYIGSRPGRIISAIRDAGSNNPVFMLDEVDKLGADFRGDPASALLEVLDPEQNDTFTDHYMEVPFDLSRVLFIATANTTDPVPPALQDRMEMIEFPGYTENEKRHIATQYLVPQQIEANGLEENQLELTDGAIRRLIERYTRESGVRQLERQIGSLCRKVAKEFAMEGTKQRKKIQANHVPDFLGPPKYTREVAERLTEPGVAAGLAVTPTGGQILFVEATRTPGDGKLTLTGKLGDVMKESAQAALTHLKAHHERFGVDPEIFKNSDFHIHVPAGATPKDGPSAGITITIALTSLCRREPVKHTVGSTGEITLRGKVLPVGGIKNKVLAALQAGLDSVIMPERNEKDMEDVPAYAKRHLDFHFVDKVEQAMPLVFEDWDVEQTAGEKAAAKAAASS